MDRRRWLLILAIGIGCSTSVYCQNAIELDLDLPSDDYLIDSPDGFGAAGYLIGGLPDGRNGIAIALRAGQGFRLYGPVIDTGPGVVLVQCLLKTTNPDISVAVAGLNAPAGGTLADIDGGLATNAPANGAKFMDDWSNLELFHNPEGNGIVPVFQAVNPSGTDAVVYLDSITIVPLHEAGASEIRERLHFDEAAITATPTPTLPAAVENVLTIRVNPKTAGKTYILIRGKAVQFAFVGSLPSGSEDIEPYSTTINGVNWSADWLDGAATSSVYTAPRRLLPETGGYEYELEAYRTNSYSGARALPADLQTPKAANGYLGAIAFNANDRDLFEFTLRWKTAGDTEPTPELTPYPTATPTPALFPEDQVESVPYRRFGLGEVECAAYSPDGRYAATGGLAGAFLWDAATGERLHDLQVPHRPSTAKIVFSQDGERLATAGEDFIARVWSTSTGDIISVLNAHTRIINSIAISPDGEKVLTASMDEKMFLWDAGTGGILRAYQAEDDRTYAIFSPDGKTFLTNNEYGAIVQRDLLTGDIIRVYARRGGKYGASICYSSDGSKILIGAFATQNMWEILDAGTGSLLTNSEVSSTQQYSMADACFAPGDAKVISRPEYGARIDSWDAASGELLRSYERDEDIAGAAFSPDLSQILIASQDYNSDYAVGLFDAETDEPAVTFVGHCPRVRALDVSPDETRIATGHSDSVWIWDIDNVEEPLYKFPRKLWEGNGLVDTIAFSPDGLSLAVACESWIERGTSAVMQDFYESWGDGIARILDAGTGALIQEFVGHEHGIGSVRFSSDGATLLTGSGDETAKLWDVETGNVLRTYTGAGGSITRAVFSPDERWIVTGGFYHPTRLLDAATGEELFTFGRNNHGFDFSPDGSRIAVGGEGEVTEWSTETWAALHHIKYTLNNQLWANNDAIETVVYSQDGAQIAHSLFHSTLVWDAATAEFQQAFLDTGPPMDIEYLSDGESVVTGSFAGTVSIWRLGN